MRANRLSHNLYVLLHVGVVLISALPFSIASSVSGEESTLTALAIIPFALVLLGTIVFRVFLMINRLHDMGWSAWLAFLVLVPGGSLFLIIVLFCVPSKPEENQYGACPHGFDWRAILLS